MLIESKTTAAAYLNSIGVEMTTRTYTTNEITDLTSGIKFLDNIPEKLGRMVTPTFRKLRVSGMKRMGNWENFQTNIRRDRLVDDNVSHLMTIFGPIERVSVELNMFDASTEQNLTGTCWITLDIPPEANVDASTAPLTNFIVRITTNHASIHNELAKRLKLTGSYGKEQ